MPISQNKLIINDQPKSGDVSHYNFVDNYSVNPPNHEESLSLPYPNDKFQDKDLHTTVIGSDINEKIIENNMKFSGSSFIKIDNIRIDNAGVNYKVKNIRVKGFIFSQEAFREVLNDNDANPLEVGYGDLNTVLNDSGDKFCFYNSTFSRKNKGQSLGNIGAIEGVEIVSNFGVVSSGDVDIGDMPGNDSFNTGTGSGDTFDITSNTPTIADIINDIDDNPLYIAFWMRGNAKRWFGTDRRKKRIQVYKINNLDLFANNLGKVSTFTWDGGSADNTRTGAGGRGGAEAAAFKITQFKVTINTLSGEYNTGIDQTIIDKYIGSVLPPFRFNITDFKKDLFLQTTPSRQLNNTQDPGSEYGLETFPNYFPFTYFGILDIDGEQNFDYDLQNYYPFASQQSLITSAPATVKFVLSYVNPDTSEVYDTNDFVSFVVDWNDENDEIKTIDDALNNRPNNLVELQSLQSQGLYTSDTEEIEHTYLTPGIKTVKIITISYDKTTGQLGRWKMIKARFYLDIPITEFPDFSEVGGSDYTTIPWPFTTAIIGGVSENSKYKISIQNTLSSGNIGNTDIIDEKFLINDLENNQLGKAIENMDLEQCRYFNTGSYNMNTLLEVNPITDDGFKPYNYIIENPNYIEDVFFKDVNHSSYSNKWFGELESSGNRTGTDLYEQKQYVDNSKGIHIKYTASDITGNVWTFFRYMRTDLHNNLKTFEEGGTEYTFKFDIKFNEFTPNAPISYIFRAANRDNDYGYSYRQGDFKNGNLHFYRGNDGVYSDSGLNDKLGNYGDWITIEKTRKLISNYSSSRTDGYVDGYPNMEFLTNNWNDTFDLDNNTGETDPQFLSTLPFPEYLEEFDINGEGDLDSFDTTQWGNVSRPDITMLLYYLGTGDLSIPNTEIDFFNYTYPEYVQEYVLNAQGEDFSQSELSNGNVIPRASDEGETPQSIDSYYNIEFFGDATLDFDIRNPIMVETEKFESMDESALNQDKIYWDGDINKFSEESSVGQIFIGDNLNLDLKQSCKLELNTGYLSNKSIYDSSGNSNKGLLIGDYKVKKPRKGEKMRRDSFIKVPKKKSNRNGAL